MAGPAEAGSAVATFGERLADQVAAKIGSWPFLVIQNTMFVLWMTANVVAMVSQWDPYPFILLNLVLSFQAAETGPILLISQNRAAQRDRIALLTLKAEFEEMAEDHRRLHAEHRAMHEDHIDMHAEQKSMHAEVTRMHGETQTIQRELLELLRRSGPITGGPAHA